MRRPKAKRWAWLVAAALLLGLGLCGALVTETNRRWNEARRRLAELPAEARRTGSAWTPHPSGAGRAPPRVRVSDAFGSAPHEPTSSEMPSTPPLEAGAPAPWTQIPKLLPWLRAVRKASDERLPTPPADLVAWLDSLEERLNRLVDDLADSGVDDIDLGDSSERLAVERAIKVVAAAAAVDAWRGDHARASLRLDVAWRLNERIGALDFAELDPRFLLGVLRATRVSDPPAWLRRLDAVDLRADDMELEVDRAQFAVLQGEYDDSRGIARWPAPMRPFVNAWNRVLRRWNSAKTVKEALDTRAALLALEPCDDALTALPSTWQRDQLLRRWLPAPSALEVARHVAWLAREEAELAITREVVARRAAHDAGTAEPPRCRPASLVVAASPDGRVTLSWAAAIPVLSPDHGRGWFQMDASQSLLTTFTFTPASEPPRPVLASAPRLEFP